MARPSDVQPLRIWLHVGYPFAGWNERCQRKEIGHFLLSHGNDHIQPDGSDDREVRNVVSSTNWCNLNWYSLGRLHSWTMKSCSNSGAHSYWSIYFVYLQFLPVLPEPRFGRLLLRWHRRRPPRHVQRTHGKIKEGNRRGCVFARMGRRWDCIHVFLDSDLSK